MCNDLLNYSLFNHILRDLSRLTLNLFLYSIPMAGVRRGGAPHQLNLSVSALVVVAARFLIRQPLKTPVATKGRARSPTPPINPQTKPHASGINWKTGSSVAFHIVFSPTRCKPIVSSRSWQDESEGRRVCERAAFCISGRAPSEGVKGQIIGRGPLNCSARAKNEKGGKIYHMQM